MTADDLLGDSDRATLASCTLPSAPHVTYVVEWKQPDFVGHVFPVRILIVVNGAEFLHLKIDAEAIDAVIAGLSEAKAMLAKQQDAARLDSQVLLERLQAAA